MEPTINATQKRQIGTLRGCLKKHSPYYDERQDYYGLLETEYGVNSCTLLTAQQADKLIKRMQHELDAVLGKKPRSGHRNSGGRSSGQKSFGDMANRPTHLATVKQLKMITTLWDQVSDAPPEKRATALNVFLHRRFKVSLLEAVPKALVSKIKRTLDAMLEQKRQKETAA